MAALEAVWDDLGGQRVDQVYCLGDLVGYGPVPNEMIEFVEATPDTLISLKSGKKIMVMEPVDDVIELVIEYKRSCSQTVFSTVR